MTNLIDTEAKVDELEEYKEPTQLNGTDYYRLPVNKLKHILEEAIAEGERREREKNTTILKEMEKDETHLAIKDEQLIKHYAAGVLLRAITNINK